MAKAKRVWSQHVDTRYGDLCCRFNESNGKYCIYLQGKQIDELADQRSGIDFLDRVFAGELNLLSKYVGQESLTMKWQTKVTATK